jgi:CelD/BcsL family acetyltransferase involved in cellulose biosynthesis
MPVHGNLDPSIAAYSTERFAVNETGMSEMRAELVVDSSQLGALQATWTELGQQHGAYNASYESYRDAISSADAKMRLILLREDGKIVMLAPYLLHDTHKHYWIGARRLFSLPIRELRLVGNSFIGKVTATGIRCVLDLLYPLDEFDLMSLSELEFNGPFHRSLQNGIVDTRWSWARGFYQNTLHWSIDLPLTFDEYMRSFSKKTRQHLQRKVRKFEREHNGALRIIRNISELDSFLELGERISRLTYQWNIGDRLCADEATRRAYATAAAEGRVRCYLLYSGDNPCAFGRGVIQDRTYHYETPGFDPAYEKASPGTVLLLKVIEDVIANTNCKTFDFGSGGDKTGYKSVFGNRSYEAIWLELFRKGRTYPSLLLAIQAGLFALNRTGQSVVGPKLKLIIRQRLRKYGC